MTVVTDEPELKIEALNFVEGLDFIVYAQKNTKKVLPSELNYSEKFNSEVGNVTMSPKQVAQLDGDSYEYLVIGKVELTLGVKNSNNQDMEILVNLTKLESTAEKIIQYVIVVIFSLIGILSCLYCITMVITSKQRTDLRNQGG